MKRLKSTPLLKGFLTWRDTWSILLRNIHFPVTTIAHRIRSLRVFQWYFGFGGGKTLKFGFLLHLIDVISDWIGKITSFLMVAIIGYMFAGVITRYFLKSPINYLSIVPNILFVYISLGAAYAYNQRAFITVDIFYRKFSTRKRAALDLFTSVLFFLFMLALLQASGLFALPALAKFKFDMGMLIDPARWPTTIIFPIGPILLLIAGTVRFIRNVIILINGEEEASSEKEKVGAQEERV